MGLAGLSGGEDGMLIAGGVYAVTALVVGGLFLLFGVPHIVVGLALRRRRPWSRVGALVLGVIALTNLPLGTLLGVYTIVKMVDPEARAELEGFPPGGHRSANGSAV
jgi:hypothetical protein